MNDLPRRGEVRRALVPLSGLLAGKERAAMVGTTTHAILTAANVTRVVKAHG